MDDITEFTWVDPDEIHLVHTPANAFASPLLAKAAEALDFEVGNVLSGDRLVKYVSAAARRKYAESGVAMANGAFPIPDEGHLRSAIGRLAEYKGDRAAAKAHIIRRARVLHLVHLLPKEWHVEKQTAPDKAVPEAEAESQTHEVDEGAGAPGDGEPGDGGEPRSVSFPHGPDGDGQGDTAPDKTVPRGDAQRQTHEMGKATVDIGGDAAPGGAAEARSAEDQASAQPDTSHEEPTGETPEERDAAAYANKSDPFVAQKAEASADSDPGSPAWEHKDVALGEEAEKLVARLAEVVHTFTEREKAEGGTRKGARRALKALGTLLDANPHLQKEIEKMDVNELLKALDERDAARRAAEKKAAKKAAKAQKAAEGAEAAKDAKASKAAKGAGDKLEKRLKKAEALLAKVAGEPAGRPMLNAMGAAAVLRGPARESALKEFDDRVASAEDRLAKATNEFEKMRAEADVLTARQQRATAKLIAGENARERGQIGASRLGPNTVELFKNTGALPDDHAIGGR